MPLLGEDGQPVAVRGEHEFGGAIVEAGLRDAAPGVGEGDDGRGVAMQGEGPAVEAAVFHGVDVVEEVGDPDLGVAAVLGVEGRLGQQLGTASTGRRGVERRDRRGRRPRRGRA